MTTEQPQPAGVKAAAHRRQPGAGGRTGGRRWFGFLRPRERDAARRPSTGDGGPRVPAPRASGTAPGGPPATTEAASGTGSAAGGSAPATTPGESSTGPGTPGAAPAENSARTTTPAGTTAPAGNPTGTEQPTDSSADTALPARARRRQRRELPAHRPPEAPPDPWTAFATSREQQPGPVRCAGRALRRSLIHEYALAAYSALLVAVAFSWPLLRYPLHTFSQDVGDPSRQAWQLAWLGHILRTDPIRVWHTNAYYPVRDSLAWGDSLLGYAPFTLIGDGPEAAVLRYNLLFVLAHALLVFGGYVLVRQLGGGRTGAAVAALAFAYAPWRLSQEGHLDVVSAGAIPLALAMLARGHGWSLRHGFRPERRHAGWAAGGWLVAVWQLSLGFSLGIPFAYALGLVVLFLLIAVPIRRLRNRAAGPVLGWHLLLTDLFGTLVFLCAGVLLAIPYFRVEDPGTTAAEIAFFSPPPQSLLIGPAESRIWGAAHAAPRSALRWAAEMSLLPGFVLYALAIAGLIFSVWTVRQRLLLLLGLAGTVSLVLGASLFGGRWTYLPLFGHYPASLGQGVPGRLTLWVTLLLAVLAAGTVAEFVRRIRQYASRRMPPWPGPWLRFATLVPFLLVAVESWNATAHPVVPAQPAAMRTVTGPMLVLPTGPLTDHAVLLWSTSRFQRLANGGGSFAAARQGELRRTVAGFPDQASIDYLRAIRVNRVLLLRQQAQGTPWERVGDMPVDLLGIRREDVGEDAVLFHLD